MNTWCDFFSLSENSRKNHDPNLLHPHFGGTVLNPRSSANYLAKNVKYVENNGILADLGGFLTIFDVILGGF